MSDQNNPTYEELGQRVGALVDRKNAAYGSAFDKAGDFLRLLYPNGIQPDQYSDALCLVRIFDKMVRIATDRDALGESPYQDIAGYGLLGLHRVERERAVLESQEPETEEIPQRMTMGNTMEIQNENPMFPPLVPGLKKADLEVMQKGRLSPDQHVRIPARKKGA